MNSKKISSIQVLGSGCPSCHKLFELVKRAVKELELETKVEYVNDVQKIISMGVMQVPVLTVDGKPVLTGSLFDVEKIKKILIGKKASEKETGKSGCSCGGKC